MENIFTMDEIRLTGITGEDLSTIEKWYTNSQFLENFDTDIAVPKTRKQLEEEYLRQDHQSFSFAVRRRDSKEIIGLTGLHSIEWNNQVASLFIGIGGRKNQGKGYGKAIMRMLLTFAFEELNLYKVTLSVISYNRPAITLYQHCGFKIEGQLTEMVYRHNQRHDVLIMGLSRAEWQINKR